MKTISTIASLVRNTLSVSLNLSPFKTPAGLMERKLFSLAAVAALFLSASVFAAPDPQKPSVKFGFSPGPYEDLWEKAIKPAFEKKGYKTEKVVFQDWVQPNKALSNGDIDVNIFQHVIYLRKFIEDNGLKPLDEIIKIPTAGLGAYSNTAKSVKDLKKGDKVTLALDPTNLARSLRFLAAIKWITLKKESDPTKATLNDIGENPFGLLETAKIRICLYSIFELLAFNNFFEVFHPLIVDVGNANCNYVFNIFG
ncbi:hypothetical protein AGMMS49938_07040 [Fibrobacterales bacterium]|nr:hypothetical protein AGMMS49938_07040 [Fibrobacterales bacterium]